MLKLGLVTGAATTQPRRQSFALHRSLSAGHSLHSAREATMSENTPACSTGHPTYYTVSTMFPRSARNISTTILRGTRVSSNLLPTTVRTAHMTLMGCSTLRWMCMQTTSSSLVKDVPDQAARQAQRRALLRPSHRHMLLRPLLVRLVLPRLRARKQLPRRPPCQR